MTQTLTTEFKNEAAKSQNRPIELYDIYLGSQSVCDDQTYHYCTTNKRISFFNLDGGVQNYDPFRITREPIPASNQLEVEMFAGEFNNTDRVWSDWSNNKDLRGKRVVVRKVFLDLLTDATHSKIIFDGEINALAELSETSAKIQVRSKLKSLSVQPGAMQQLYCNWIFCDEFCGINVATVSAADQTIDIGSTENEIVDAARIEDDDYWIDGLIRFLTGKNTGEERQVVDFISAQNKIVLDYGLPEVPDVGDTYTIERGCDKCLSTCTNRFGNQANFLGFVDIPILINYRS